MDRIDGTTLFTLFNIKSISDGAGEVIWVREQNGRGQLGEESHDTT